MDAAVDDARCDRVVLLLLAAYVAVWTLYASIARSAEGLHPDMTELIAWSRDLSLGYLKHPPLAAWLVRIWLSILPLAEWSYYLLAMLMPTVALWIFWRLSADYLELNKRVVGLALLTFIPFYNFHAIKFNVNTVLLPTWAATTFWFLRSYRSRSAFYAALTGIGMAGCMLGKYWSVFLVVGLFGAALLDSRRAVYFRSRAPWITALVGLGLLSPHLLWLFQHNFAPFEYASAQHDTGSYTSAAIKALGYLAGSAGYVALPIALVLLIVRPSRAVIGDMMWPVDQERRLLATAFYGPLLLPIATVLYRANLTSLWSMSAWTLLPIVLLSPPEIRFEPLQVRRILQLAFTIPLGMLIAAPAIAVIVHLRGVRPIEAAQGALLAAEVERDWHETTAQPLRFVGCDAADEVVAYAQDQPRSLPPRSFHGDVGDIVYAYANGWPPPLADKSELSEDELSKAGVALVCLADVPGWVDAATKYAARTPGSQRIDVQITRDFLGIAGMPQQYAIFVIPPRS
jgi:hypothetical protein